MRPYVCLVLAIIVTQHEKIGLMCIHLTNNLMNIHRSLVQFTPFMQLCIGNLMHAAYRTLNSKGDTYTMLGVFCAHKPSFLMPGDNLCCSSYIVPYA